MVFDLSIHFRNEVPADDPDTHRGDGRGEKNYADGFNNLKDPIVIAWCRTQYR